MKAKNGARLFFWRSFSIIALAISLSQFCGAYSVLTHEEVVDLLWKDDIQPLLLKRFPSAKPDDLTKAHAYAYGGCLVQDMGYYPFGNKAFSDLTHYVRSGDFIVYLIKESQDLNEYAFALGALAHYSADFDTEERLGRVSTVSATKPMLTCSTSWPATISQT